MRGDQLAHPLRINQLDGLLIFDSVSAIISE